MLSESSDPDPWDQYADVVGDQLDAIEEIPAPKAAIGARVEALLKTRTYSEGLSHERDLVERIFETTPIAQTVLDPDGTIVRANQQAETLFGPSESAVAGRSFDSPEWAIIDEQGDPIPSEDLPFARVMESGDPIYGYEHRIERPDGEIRSLSINMGPLRDESGEIEYLVSAIDDITDVRATERQLRRTQQAIEAADHAVFISDTERRIEYVNPAFERITGYDRETVIGKHTSILHSGEMPDEHYDRLWATVESGQTWREEITNRRKDGGLYHAMQTIDPIVDDTGTIEGFVAIQTDISDDKDRLRQLEVMDRVLRHDLRNFMSVIRGYAETIEAEGVDPLSAYAGKISTYSDKLLTLTEDQRKIIEVLTTEPNLAPRDIGSLTDRAIDSVRTDYPDARIEVAHQDRVLVSATEIIGEAIEEIIENAIEHTDQELPEIHVSLAESGETVEIRIADAGPGIPEMERGVLTGERDIESLYHSSGFGLWLVSWIVRRSNGRLEFEERTPRGTVVVITLEQPDRPDPESDSRGG